MRIITIFLSIIMTTINLSVSVLAIKPVRKKAGEILLNWVVYQMDKEEAERLEKMERHEVVRGKDTVFIWNKHYYILRHMGEMRFGVQNEEIQSNIFQKVDVYDAYKNMFYVVAKDGYAVVDRDNFCRVFLLTKADEIESKYIEYLASYQDYSEEEREHFSKMIKKQKVDLYK